MSSIGLYPLDTLFSGSTKSLGLVCDYDFRAGVRISCHTRTTLLTKVFYGQGLYAQLHTIAIRKVYQGPGMTMAQQHQSVAYIDTAVSRLGHTVSFLGRPLGRPVYTGRGALASGSGTASISSKNSSTSCSLLGSLRRCLHHCMCMRSRSSNGKNLYVDHVGSFVVIMCPVNMIVSTLAWMIHLYAHIYLFVLPCVVLGFFHPKVQQCH